jgi:hypothetical protein
MKMILLLISLLPMRAIAVEPAEMIAAAWHSQEARQNLGLVVYSYYEYSYSSETAAAGTEGMQEAEDFSQDLDAFLDGQGLANDCALVHALWFDMGEGAAGDIEDEIMDRGPRMLPILAYALKELAQNPQRNSGDCGIVRLDDASIQESYEDCVKGIKQDAQKRSI